MGGPEPTLIAVGDTLAGKYRVTKVLGVGGMGMVLAATHLELDERVAIKTMLPDMLHSPQHAERFLREAKAAVKLRGEHVCRVLDVGKLENAAPYIVMEFLDGHDFARLLEERGALPIAEAVGYLLQALEGVAEAHCNGIVHRDLKPQNLFVTTGNDGLPLVKVVDFGISKSSLGGSATKTGDIMGSPAYMAPEQMMSSKDVDARADVWSMGVILYQAITGQRPFDGDTLPALCMAVMHDPPPPLAAFCSGLPAGFEDVVTRCLHKDPAQRIPDVAALAKALAPFGGEQAASSAERVRKVLSRGRASSAPVIATEPAKPATAPAATAPAAARGAAATPQPVSAAPRVGQVSTLQASSGALEKPVVAARSRRWMWAGLGALATTMIVVAALLATRGEQTRSAATTTQPPTAITTTATATLDAGGLPVDAAAIVESPANSGSASAPLVPPVANTVETRVTPAKPVTAPKKSATTTTAKRPAQPSTPRVSCDPPYTLDPTGKRLYKQECL